MLFLMKSLARHAGARPVRLSVVANNVCHVVGDEPLAPSRAGLVGLCAVVSQEYPHIACRTIDLGGRGDHDTPGYRDTETNCRERAAWLWDELNSNATEPVVACRHGFRWVQSFEKLPSATSAERAVRLRRGGVYLITGGLGSVAFTLAGYLAETAHSKLVLLGRSSLPARTEWERWREDHGPEDPTSVKIARVRALEAMGSEVMVVQADVADTQAMEAAVGAVRERFGTIHGVIHAAGVTGGHAFKPLDETGVDTCALHFRSKARGLEVLERVLRGTALDFFMVTSSLASILGGIGLGAYAAANAFMDVFVQRKRRDDRAPWVSVNWDAWRFDAADAHTHKPGARLLELALTPAEGREAFRRVLSRTDLDQVIVSTADLNARRDRWAGRRAERMAPADAGSRARLYARPDLGDPAAPPRSGVEAQLVELWQEVLGVAPIGIHDSFFELGGDSLQATHLMSRIRLVCQIELPLRTLFEAPDVAGLADRIETLRWAAAAQPATISGSRAGREVGEL